MSSSTLFQRAFETSGQCSVRLKTKPKNADERQRILILTDTETLMRWCKKSPGFIARGFPLFRREGYYAAFASVVAGAGAGGVVEGGSVASIGTTFPFPIRLAELHAAKVFASSAAALFT